MILLQRRLWAKTMKSIEEQLIKIPAQNIKLDNGKTPVEMLKEAADELCDCIQKRIDDYYDSYTPKIYERKNWLNHSLKVDDIVDIKYSGNTISLSINFNDYAWHLSLGRVYNPVIHSNFYIPIHYSYVPLLMNYGWHSRKLEEKIGRVIPRFTRFEGVHFIEDGIDDFNKKNKWGVKIKLDIPDKRNYQR